MQTGARFRCHLVLDVTHSAGSSDSSEIFIPSVLTPLVELRCNLSELIVEVGGALAKLSKDVFVYTVLSIVHQLTSPPQFKLARSMDL